MPKTIQNNSLWYDISIVVIFLMAIGTVFVFSAGADVTQEPDLRRFYDFAPLRQILFLPLAVAIMYGLCCIDYRKFSLDRGWLKSPISYLLAVSIVLLIIVLLPRFGTQINYARRWFRIPVGSARVSFQPSELAKWSVVLFLAGVCGRLGGGIRLYWKQFIPICLVVGVIAGLIIIEDFGTGVFICLLAFLMLAIGGAKFWHILTPVPFCAAGFVMVLFRSPGRIQRIAAFFHPAQWADSVAYQANQSLTALGSGGIFGKGLGNGICKYGHLPEDTTDFVFAVIGEELGFVGAAAVILLFIIFVWLGILVVVRSRDRFGQFLAAAIVLTIGIQAVLNIGVVTVVLPTKGIPLPFVSAGGTSMLLSAAAVGVLLNVAKQTVRESAGQQQ